MYSQDTSGISHISSRIGLIWSRYKKIIQWILAFLCILWVGHYFYEHRQDLELFKNLSAAHIVILLGLFSLHLWLYSLTFFLVFKCCTKGDVPFLEFFKTIILGRFLSSIAPQAGNVYRAVYLKHTFGISYTRYISGFFCFLWIDAAMNILLSAAVFGFFEPSMHIGKFSVWWILTAMGAAWFLPIACEGFFKRFTLNWPAASWLHARTSELLKVSLQSLSDKKMLLGVVAVNMVNFANNMLIIYLCFYKLASAITIPMIAVFFVLLKLCSYLIITPGNIGIREIAYGFVGTHMGLEPGQGIVLSIFYRLFGMITVALFGIYFGGMGLLFTKPQDNPEQVKDNSVL